MTTTLGLSADAVVLAGQCGGFAHARGSGRALSRHAVRRRARVCCVAGLQRV